MRHKINRLHFIATFFFLLNTLSNLYLISIATAADAPVRVVCLGDSITKGVRAGVAADETFAALLQAELGRQKIKAEVINTGIGGERTDQALARLERDVIARKPAVVTVMYGANDSYVDIGKSEPRLTQMQFRQNLLQLVDRLQAEKIRVILMTEPRWGAKAKPNGAGEQPNLRMEPFMATVREVAQLKKTGLVDHYEIWTRREREGLDIGTITTDQLHPNPAGHKVLSQAILPELVKALKGTD